MKTVAIRFNVCAKVGKGHFARCNEIAKELRLLGAHVVALISTLCDMPLEHQFDDVLVVEPLLDASQSASHCKVNGINTVLVDHYHCNYDYQRVLTDSGLALAQYDNRCEGKYSAKLIININPAATHSWYQDCDLEASVKLLLGVDYAVLNPNIAGKAFYPTEKGLFICFGGGNDNGASYQIAKQLSHVYPYPIHLACSDKSLSAALHAQEQPQGITLHINQSNLLRIIQHCNTALITAGTLSYEMCYLGMPFAYGYVADNQVKIASSWQKLEVGLYIGSLQQALSDANLSTLIHYLLNATALKQGECLDANGAKRIAKAISCL
ncbi:hypothetical protein V1358_06380 [Pseudoalteromonas sp. YIC-656]|uniref:hypothetical protein n=1 Tax=Pseudoalteromonas pernae TaxID=3118054 RepID=UPI003242D366